MKRHSDLARRRGVATFFAVAALGLVATAILAMSTMLRIDHRRTAASVGDAQLRQLLMAGAADAQTRLNGQLPSESWVDVSLPDALVDRDAAVRWQRDSADVSTVEITVTASFGPASARQKLIFVPGQSTTAWDLIEAKVLP